MMAKTARGFTLIEVLVVLVVIGIAVSVVGLNTSGGTRRYELENAVREFYQRMQLAQEEAILMNREIALHMERIPEPDNDRYTYQWLLLLQDENGKPVWRPHPDAGFKRREFPFGVGLELEVEQVLVDLIPDESEDSGDLGIGGHMPGLKPQVFLFSSGEMTPFRVQFGWQQQSYDDPQSQYRLVGNTIGRMKLLTPGEDEYALD